VGITCGLPALLSGIEVSPSTNFILFSFSAPHFSLFFFFFVSVACFVSFFCYYRRNHFVISSIDFFVDFIIIIVILCVFSMFFLQTHCDSGGYVYAASLDGKVYAFNAVSGALRAGWGDGSGKTASVGAPFLGGAVVDEGNGLLFAGALILANPRLYAFDLATGVKKVGWNGASNGMSDILNGKVHRQPALANGKVYVSTYAADGRVYCFTASDGTGCAGWPGAPGTTFTVSLGAVVVASPIVAAKPTVW